MTASASDAGFADAGVDGGADASTSRDASVQADAGMPPEAGGCRVASARSPASTLVVFGALALVLARRRRSRA